MKRVYRLNSGSCGACDIEIQEVVLNTPGLEWAYSPQDADVLLLTGPIAPGIRAALLNLLREAGEKPLLAIGRCSIDGHPFGKGGVQQEEDLTVQLNHRLDGCPPTPEAIKEVLETL